MQYIDSFISILYACYANYVVYDVILTRKKFSNEKIGVGNGIHDALNDTFFFIN